MSSAAHAIADAASARRPSEPPLPVERQRRLVEALEAAQAFYVSRRSSSWVPEYLADRRLDISEAGYAPGGGSMLRKVLLAEGFTDDELRAAGLVCNSHRGDSLVDRFKARLMLPIRDGSGDLVGFVGRIREGARGPKYMNSPASPLYDKSSVLMGLYEGAEALRAGAVAVFVEGPTDRYAVTGATAGAAVGLATGGTSLTAGHIAALGEVVDLRSHPIVYATDDDEAGIRAAAKGWELLAAAGVDPELTRRARLGGHDPASLLSADGAAAVASMVLDESAPLLVDAYADAVLARWSRHLDNAMARIDALREVARNVSDQLDDEKAVTAVMGRLAGRHEVVDAGEAGQALADVRSGVAAPAIAPGGPVESAGATVLDFPSRDADADADGPGAGGGGGGSGPGGGGDEPEYERVIIRDRFRATEGGLYKVKVDSGNRRELWSELLPVRVRLGSRIVEDLGDGSQPTMTHVDLIASRGEEEHELSSVDRKRWESCGWVSELPWSAPFNDTAGGRSTLRNAVTATSGDVPLVRMYGSLGWQHIKGRWCYVHAGGVRDANGPVEGVRVNVLPPLKPFTLPASPASEEELRAAVMASTAALDALPARLAAPLLGSAYRAVLGFSRVTVMPVGGKAGGKTSLAALAAQHYAPTARHDEMPGAGAGEDAGTTVGLEELRFRAGDMLLPLDDLAPDRGTERASVRAAQIARSQYNRTGKIRGNRDGGVRAVHPPRSLPLVTGEEGTTVESAESRIVSLRVARGDVDIDCAMPLLDQGIEPELRAKLTAAMVQHYAAAMPMTDWLRSTTAALRAELRDPEAVDVGLDVRHAESVAELAAGWRAMLDMATERGALTEDEATELWARAWSGLAEAKSQLVTGSATRTAADRMRELLTSALVRRDIGLLSRNGGAPEYPERCGWEKDPALNLTGHRLSATPVGWTDGEKVWLQPGAVFPALVRQAQGEHDPLTYTRVGLGQALADAGVIRTRTRGGVRATTVPVRLGNEGQVFSVWELDYEWLFPSDTADEAGPSPEPPPPPAPIAPTPKPVEPAPAPPTPVGTPKPGVSDSESGCDSQPSPSAGESPPQGSEAAQSDPEPAGTSQPSSRRRTALAKYRGAAAVCEPGKVWLAKPGAEPESFDLPAEASLPVLLDGLAELKLGHVDGRGQYWGAPEAWGQAWVTPELRRDLSWPATLDESSAKARKVEAALSDAGWQVLGKVGFWTRITREGARLILVIPDWLETPTSLGEQDASARTLADRLARFAAATGIAWQWSPGSTAVQLAAVTRPRLLKRGPQKLPAPAGKPNREHDFSWQRPPTPAEERMQYAHLWDFNALYLGAASSLPLAWGEYEHVKAPDLDLNRPGYWKVPQEPWAESLLPDPFVVYGRGAGKTMIVSTPTLKTAVELLEWDVEPLEAWLAVDTLEGTYDGRGKPPPGHPGSKGYGRLLDKWSSELSQARLRMSGSSDADDTIIGKNIKATYAHGVGRFDRQADRPGKGERLSTHPLWRPDWRHHIVAQARYVVMRRILEAERVEHRHPLAVMTDGVVFASDNPDPAEALPAGFVMGERVGQVDHEGIAPLEAITELLRKGSKPSKTIPGRSRGLADVIRRGGLDDG